MLRSHSLTGLSVALLLGACAPAEQPVEEAPDTEADMEAITSVREQERTALEAGDVEALLALNTADVVWMPPDEPAANGAEALRSWTESLFGQFEVQFEDYSTDAVEVLGDWAYERYSGTVTLTPAGGGDAVSEPLKGIHILRRQPDGSWKIAVDIWNASAPPAAQE